MTAVTVVDRDTGEVLAEEGVHLGTLRAANPQQLLAAANAIATPLAKLIEDRKLYSTISGKRYVRAEGWVTLCAMLGCTPHEVGVTEPTDGTFVATVEFRRLSDGQPVARASAECGLDEPTWRSRPRYARRSMALTRATAKAARLAFSWVVVLAGFEPTPAEEIPHDDVGGEDAGRKTLPTTVPFGKEKGKALADCSPDYLASMRQWCADKGKFGDFIEAIDLELERRREATV